MCTETYIMGTTIRAKDKIDASYNNIYNQTLTPASFIYRYSCMHKQGVGPTGQPVLHYSSCINATLMSDHWKVVIEFYKTWYENGKL